MTSRRKLLVIIASFFVVLGVVFLTLFLVARSATTTEWQSRLTPRTPAERRGLVEAMTKFASEPPNFLPLSSLDDEVCAAAVVNAVNFILGEDYLTSSPAWLFSKTNADKVTKIYDRSEDFEIRDGRIVETRDRGFRLSQLLSPNGLYVLGYHYHETQSDHKIIAAGEGMNSHLMLLLGQNNGRWYGYHLIHYPETPFQNPVLVEPVDEMPKVLDLVYIWQVKGVEIPDQGEDLFIANTNPSYRTVRRWINLGPAFMEYYLDTISTWFMGQFKGTQQFPIVINLKDKSLVEVPLKGELFHGRILGFFNRVPVYYHAGESERGTYGLEFQCVEYVNRFLVSLGHRNLARTGHADSYFWQAASKGLKAYTNNGATRPQVNDLLVFDKSNNDASPGHIAVIYSVTDDYVCFVQQNVGTKWRDCLPMWKEIGGRWRIVIPADRSFYPPVAGWSRLEDKP